MNDIKSVKEIEIIISKYANITLCEECDMHNFNKNNLLFSNFYEDMKMNQYAFEEFFNKESFILDYKYNCDKKEVNFDKEFIVFYKVSSNYDESNYDSKYIDTKYKAKLSDIVAVKYKNIFVKLNIS